MGDSHHLSCSEADLSPPLTTPKPLRVELGESEGRRQLFCCFCGGFVTLQYFQITAVWSIFCKIRSQAKSAGFRSADKI